MCTLGNVKVMLSVRLASRHRNKTEAPSLLPWCLPELTWPARNRLSLRPDGKTSHLMLRKQIMNPAKPLMRSRERGASPAEGNSSSIKALKNFSSRILCKLGKQEEEDTILLLKSPHFQSESTWSRLTGI